MLVRLYVTLEAFSSYSLAPPPPRFTNHRWLLRISVNTFNRPNTLIQKQVNCPALNYPAQNNQQVFMLLSFQLVLQYCFLTSYLLSETADNEDITLSQFQLVTHLVESSFSCCALPSHA